MVRYVLLPKTPKPHEYIVYEISNGKACHKEYLNFENGLSFSYNKLLCAREVLVLHPPSHRAGTHYSQANLYRKWKRVWTQCWFSGRPSGSSRRGQWQKPFVNWPGSKNAGKSSTPLPSPSFTTTSAAGISTKKPLTPSLYSSMRKSPWLQIKIS